MLDSKNSIFLPIRDDHLKALIQAGHPGEIQFYNLVTYGGRAWGQDWYIEIERSRRAFLVRPTYKDGISDHFSPMEILRFVL